ncbi:hypothetical protein C8Q80DRAFT_1350486 [Daedaleopsis nitida]|nr:hypothetical protein C8Q80DRAFT_1350486 [Daedaleopsis nitida]
MRWIRCGTHTIPGIASLVLTMPRDLLTETTRFLSKDKRWSEVELSFTRPLQPGDVIRLEHYAYPRPSTDTEGVVYDALSIHLSGQPLLPGLQTLRTPFTLTDGDIFDRFGTFMDVLLHPGLRELTFNSGSAPFDHFVKMVQQVRLVAPGLKVLDLRGDHGSRTNGSTGPNPSALSELSEVITGFQQLTEVRLSDFVPTLRTFCYLGSLPKLRVLSATLDEHALIPDEIESQPYVFTALQELELTDTSGLTYSTHILPLMRAPLLRSVTSGSPSDCPQNTRCEVSREYSRLWDAGTRSPTSPSSP